MNLILNIPPDTEIRLLQAAAQSGKAPETLALEAIEEKLPFPAEPADQLSLGALAAEVSRCAAALPRSRAVVVDDSRESIYEGCGE